MKDHSRQPIGVFDSGLGGLTVVKAMHHFLPSEDVVYFGDTARVPYGTKSKETIIRFSIENVKILLRHNVKMVVIACNSSSSYALLELKKRFAIPIVGVIEPGVQRAVAVTKNKRIGIIATPATINSGSYQTQIRKQAGRFNVTAQACPLFVPLVEAGWTDRQVTRLVAEEYLRKFKKNNIDSLILGCTHYPLLKTTLRKVLGPDVVLVDSAQQVVQAVKERLKQSRLTHHQKGRGSYRFLISDEPQHFLKSARRFLGFPLKSVERCDPQGL